MNIPDFISATILTIIGVVLAGLFIHYVKEKSSRNKIITSLFLEVSNNLDTINRNIEIMNLLQSHGLEASHIPFKTVAYVQYNRYIDPKLLQIINVDGEKHLSQAYNLIDELNRWMTIKEYVLAGDFDLMFYRLEEELNELMNLLKSKKYFKKLFKNFNNF